MTTAVFHPNAAPSAVASSKRAESWRKHGTEELAQKVETFKQMVTENPRYAQEFANSVSPYFTLVKLVDEHQEMQAMKDIDSYKAKLEAEVREKVLRELESERKAKEDLKSSIPESLVGETSQGGLTGSHWSGPTPLEAIIDN